ncbi:protein lethal(2)essential for life-like [Bacillus rossius redtenbacheri]|uniref:protein lethal(2)essential for life-like n=1 Tax=Bacillus rossius redtenbacheri TaxID=93214 RepID=UPI002FDCE943
MSMMPLLLRDWWDDADRPSRLWDQHFGLGLRGDDLLAPVAPLLKSRGYIRPWGLLGRQNSGLSTIAADKDSFKVILDVQQFSPSELTVKTVGSEVVVEGKHEEKRDEHGFVSRHFVRRYLLPPDTDPKDVQSSLSSDGVLTITSPKKAEPNAPGERLVPIVQTGLPAVKPTTETTLQPTIEQPETPKPEH